MCNDAWTRLLRSKRATVSHLIRTSCLDRSKSKLNADSDQRTLLSSARIRSSCWLWRSSRKNLRSNWPSTWFSFNKKNEWQNNKTSRHEFTFDGLNRSANKFDQEFHRNTHHSAGTRRSLLANLNSLWTLPANVGLRQMSSIYNEDQSNQHKRFKSKDRSGFSTEEKLGRVKQKFCSRRFYPIDRRKRSIKRFNKINQ